VRAKRGLTSRHHVSKIEALVFRILDEHLGRNGTLVLNGDLEVLRRVDLDKAVVDNWVEAFDDGTHKVACHLETDWSSVFNLDVEVGHAFTSVF